MVQATNIGTSAEIRWCDCARLCAGESLVVLHFTNKSQESSYVAVTPNFPAKVVPINLQSLGHIITRSGAFMSSFGGPVEGEGGPPRLSQSRGWGLGQARLAVLRAQETVRSGIYAHTFTCRGMCIDSLVQLRHGHHAVLLRRHGLCAAAAVGHGHHLPRCRYLDTEGGDTTSDVTS